MSELHFLEPYEVVLGGAWLAGILFLAYIDYRKAALDSGHRGSLARLGTVALFIVGLATFGFELLGRQGAAKQKIVETNQMVAEIQRILGRLEYITASFKLRVPARQLELENYRRTLKAGCLLAPFGFSLAGSRQVTSECFPEEADNPIAFQALGAADLQIDFFKTPLAVNEYNVLNEGSTRADLSFLALLDLGEDFALEYDSAGQAFILIGGKIRYNISEARRTGVIVSAKDLQGVRMFVSVTNRMARTPLVEEINRAAILEHLSIHFSGAPDLLLDLSEEDLKKWIDNEGMPFYSYDIDAGVYEPQRLAPAINNGDPLR